MALLSNIDLILNPNAASLSNFVSSLTNFDQCVAEADSFPNAFFFRKLCRALASVNAESKLRLYEHTVPNKTPCGVRTGPP